ncbi:hypothetical protein ABZ470_39915 [Streptosporangium sp. NPDC020072]|uniref:hypothetical protein n=1 Tax=Streptosporangium sp. NPDC020072 TaxID=3154788 RepID=UPI003427D8B0
MSRATDMLKVRLEAERLGLIWEQVGARYRVTNPDTHKSYKFPHSAVGSSLANALTTVRQLARNPPSTPDNLSTSEGATDVSCDEWLSPLRLLQQARAAGITVYIAGGILQASSPPEAEYLAQQVRDRADEIMPLLLPASLTATNERAPMPTIAETATIIRTSPTPTPPEPRKLSVPELAKEIWDLMRDEACAQGDRSLTFEGMPGVLWEGALHRSLSIVAPELSQHTREEISKYLGDTRNARCESQYAKPARWWLANTWNDGDLTVIAPEPAQEPIDAGASALEVLTGIAARLDNAERRAADAEKKRDETAKQLAETTAKLESVRKQLAEATAGGQELKKVTAERDAALARLREFDQLFGRIRPLSLDG